MWKITSCLKSPNNNIAMKFAIEKYIYIQGLTNAMVRSPIVTKFFYLVTKLFNLAFFPPLGTKFDQRNEYR